MNCVTQKINQVTICRQLQTCLCSYNFQKSTHYMSLFSDNKYSKGSVGKDMKKIYPLLMCSLFKFLKNHLLQ